MSFCVPFVIFKFQTQCAAPSRGKGWLSFAAAALASVRSDHVRSNTPDFCSMRNDRTTCPEGIRQRMPLCFMRWATNNLFAARPPIRCPWALSALFSKGLSPQYFSELERKFSSFA